MIKSPLRYPGGKSRAMKFLGDFIPPFLTLREPFFGGGAFTFFCQQQYEQTNVFEASDLNYDLFCFWNELKEQPKSLIEAVKDIKQIEKNGRALYQKLVARRNAELSNHQRAIDFFVLNRITFSGTIDAGGYSQGAFDKRFTVSSIERVEKIIPLVQKIDFYHHDYNYLLEKEGDNVLIFLDPPYYSATKSRLYGKKGQLHTGFDHQRFFTDVQKCKHRFLITYDNCDYIKNLYQNYYQLDWELQYGMNNYKQGKAAKGKEILIANFDINKLIPS